MPNFKTIFVDLETSSLRTFDGEILEFAVGTEIAGSFTIVSRKVQPEHIQTADPVSLDINGYCAKKWKTAIPKKVAAAMLYAAIKDADVWVGHNPDFDRRFVRALFKEHYPDFRLPKLVVDTRALAVAAFAIDGLQSSSMDTIRKHLGWSFEGAHTAAKDVMDCRKLYHMCRFNA